MEKEIFEKLIFISALFPNGSTAAIDLYVGSINQITHYSDGTGSFLVSGLAAKNDTTGLTFYAFNGDSKTMNNYLSMLSDAYNNGNKINFEYRVKTKALSFAYYLQTNTNL